MADYTWTGGGDGSSWNDPNNWSNDSTGDNPATSSPSGGDDATIGGATITDSGSADNIEVDGELGVAGSLTATGDVIAEADVSVIGSLTALANVENDASMTVAGGTVEATEDITNNGDIEIESGSVTATYDIDDIGSITLQAGSLTAEHDIFGSGSLDIQAGDVEVGQDIQSQGGSIEIESGKVNVGQDISLEGSSLELKSGSVEAGQDILVQGGSIDIEDGSIMADNDLDNTGTITVDGSDSILTVTNFFDDETTLSVKDSGTVEAQNLEIQDTADIDNSTLTTTGALSANGGTLTISDGSTVTASSQSSSQAAVVATNGGSIEISGGSSLDATGPGGGVIGYQGEGSLDIEGGSTVSFESDGGVSAALGIGYVNGDGTVTVDGGSSLTTNGGTVEVDSDSGSQGELDLEGGSTADFTASGGSIDALSVGNGGTGGVIVAGGSSLTVTGGGSVIGDAGGEGSMEISDGSSAEFTSPDPAYSSIIIGNDGATGTVSVEGSGSTLTAQEQLTVGNGSGSGSLDISDGASVTASSSDEEDDSAIIIGDNATGEVTVEGSGSTLETDTGNVAVGAYGGDGTLTIEDSGAANFATSDPNVNALYVGNEAGSQGTVTVDGSGSVLTVGTGGVSVGISGSGTVTVSGGGELDITDDTFGLDIATFDGSSGDVDVTGTGSTLNVAGPIYVGDTGAGTLTVEGGADFESTYSDGIGIDVGVNTGGDGTFTIDGSATDVSLDSSDGILIGDAGTGDLLIEDGATLEVSSADPDADWAIDLGTNPTGNGSITVEGIGSTLDVGDGGLDIGNNGTGSVTISDGGNLDIAGSESWVELGLTASGDGTLSLDGSDINITLDVSESLFVGDAGTGELSIEDGATLEVGSADPDGYFAVTVGNQATGDGTVAVEGAGTTLTVGDGGLSVGYAGRGSLTVSQGAMLDITDVTDGLQIGVIAAADGDVNVTGAGTELSVAGETYIGLDGTGSLTVGDGADFESTYADGVTVDLGFDATGDGTLIVEGSGTDVVLNSGDGVLVGDEGTGNLVVQGSAALDVASANPEAYFAMVLGVEATGDGTVTVDGMGTTLTVGDGGLSVGEAGQGSLTVSSGATLNITDEIFGLQIGSEANATGDIDITGDGSTLDSEGPIVIGLAGTGTLTVEEGGTLTVSEDTFISIGSQEGSDGTLTLDGETSTLDYDGPLTVGDAGHRYLRNFGRRDLYH